MVAGLRGNALNARHPAARSLLCCRSNKVVVVQKKEGPHISLLSPPHLSQEPREHNAHDWAAEGCRPHSHTQRAAENNRFSHSRPKQQIKTRAVKGFIGHQEDASGVDSSDAWGKYASIAQLPEEMHHSQFPQHRQEQKAPGGILMWWWGHAKGKGGNTGRTESILSAVTYLKLMKTTTHSCKSNRKPELFKWARLATLSHVA